MDVDGFDTEIWTVCDRLAAGSATNLLVMAGSRTDRVQEEATAHGVDAVLEKPLDQQELARTIRQLIEHDG